MFRIFATKLRSGSLRHPNDIEYSFKPPVDNIWLYIDIHSDIISFIRNIYSMLGVFYAYIYSHYDLNLNLFHFSYFLQTKSIHLKCISIFISNCLFMMFACLIYLHMILIRSFYLTRLVEGHQGIKTSCATYNNQSEAEKMQ